MLYFEDNLSYDTSIKLPSVHLKDYSSEELTYTTDKLYEAGYIDAHSVGADYMTPLFIVYSITYEGHQFLNTIRDDTIWNNTKTKVSKLSSVSIPILQEVASSIIKSMLGLS